MLCFYLVSIKSHTLSIKLFFLTVTDILAQAAKHDLSN